MVVRISGMSDYAAQIWFNIVFHQLFIRYNTIDVLSVCIKNQKHGIKCAVWVNIDNISFR